MTHGIPEQKVAWFSLRLVTEDNSYTQVHENLVGISSTTNPEPKGVTIPFPALANPLPAKGRATWVPSLEDPTLLGQVCQDALWN